MTATIELSAADLAILLDQKRLEELRHRNQLHALYETPALGAFREGAPPLPATSTEQLGAAMSALAREGVSPKGLLRSAYGFVCGRLAPEVIDDTVVSVLRRQKWGQL